MIPVATADAPGAAGYYTRRAVRSVCAAKGAMLRNQAEHS